MTKSSNPTRGCFKFGCFGCLGVIFLFIGVPLLLGGLGLLLGGAPDPEPFQEELRREILSSSEGQGAENGEAGAEATGGDSSGEASGSAVGSLGASDATVSLDEFADASGREGRLGRRGAPAQAGVLELDLTMAEVVVVPGPPEDGFRVVAEYDRASFRLEESLDTAEDGTWQYRVSFDTKVPFFRRFFGNNRIDNEIQIFVPRNLPMKVEGSLGVGESRVDLGGLVVQAVDLEYGPGDHSLDFSEPLAQPAEKIKTDGSVGEVTISRVGNASPQTVDINSGVGELQVDLSGEWRNDSDIRVSLGVGECDVRVPEGVAVDVDTAKVSVGERIVRDLEAEEMLPEGAPTLRFEVESGVGELSIRRR
ncbi:MAG: hypothetical protein AAGD01_06390 [Acidobacteriota bacterium]